MEADLHAIVRSLPSIASLITADPVRTASVRRALPVIHLSDAVRPEGVPIQPASR